MKVLTETEKEFAITTAKAIDPNVKVSIGVSMGAFLFDTPSQAYDFSLKVAEKHFIYNIGIYAVSIYNWAKRPGEVIVIVMRGQDDFANEVCYESFPDEAAALSFIERTESKGRSTWIRCVIAKAKEWHSVGNFCD